MTALAMVLENRKDVLVERRLQGFGAVLLGCNHTEENGQTNWRNEPQHTPTHNEILPETRSMEI